MNIKAFPIWGQVWNFNIKTFSVIIGFYCQFVFQHYQQHEINLLKQKQIFQIQENIQNQGKHSKETFQRDHWKARKYSKKVKLQRPWKTESKSQERLTWQFVSRTQCSFSFSWFIFHLLVVGGVNHWEASFWFCSVFWEFWFSLQQWFSLEDSSLVVSVTQISLKKQ